MHVAFYDFHTLSGRCPTAKFNYRTAATEGCLVVGGGEGGVVGGLGHLACKLRM